MLFNVLFFLFYFILFIFVVSEMTDTCIFSPTKDTFLAGL